MVSSELQNELWDSVCIINHYYEDAFRPVAADFSLTVGQLRVLHILHRFGAMTVGELALAIGMARTNTSSLCKKLCKQGYLLRNRVSGGDERQVLLELTPEGSSAAMQAESRFESCGLIREQEHLESVVSELREIARSLSPQGEQISRLARWKAKFTPAQDSRTSRVLQKAKSVFMRDKDKKEKYHGRSETDCAGNETEKTLG